MREKLITLLFCILTGGLLLLHLITPDEAISWSERRKLTQAPTFTSEFLLSGNGQKELESYMLDQFVFRDQLRRMKAFADLELFRKSDNNKIYVIENQVFKMEYPLNEGSATRLADKMEEIHDEYLSDCKTAVAVIPDKSAFAAAKNGFLSYDYYELTGLLSSELDPGEFTYVDLMDTLELTDYYRTDLHWKQEGLGHVLAKISSFFEIELPAAGLDNGVNTWETAGYRTHEYEPFYGAYYGQAALNLKPDVLRYFSSDIIDGLIVENWEEQVKEGNDLIYNPQKQGSIDSYEVFFSGNSPLITIDNPKVDTERQLIVFRDSFGSSIAPFLAEGYSRVTLIDLRFVGYENIGEFVDFNGQDVLFLYSAGVVNNSDMIRKR